MEEANEKAVLNPEKPYRIPGDRAFAPGNPGRPKGAKNHATRVREQLLACMSRRAIKRFKHRLNGNSGSREFEKAVDQVISLIGPSKPLVEIDNSKHTHFTVVLESDAKQPAA